MTLLRTKAFIRDYSKLKMSDKHFTKFVEYLNLLSQNEPLSPEARNHSLEGEWKDFRECHLSGDLLLIYQIEANVVKLVREGNHSWLQAQ